MDTIARISTQYVLGINATLVLWLWAGRILVGTAGWLLAFMPILLLPWLIPLLLLTTVLTRRRYPAAVRGTTPGRHGMTMFSRPQAVAQLTAWAGLAGTGFFLVDSTDMPPEGSVFSRALGLVLGDSGTLLTVSFVASVVCACVFAVGWLGLLVMLCTDSPRMTATRRALDEEARGEEAPREETVSGTA